MILVLIPRIFQKYVKSQKKTPFCDFWTVFSLKKSQITLRLYLNNSWTNNLLTFIVYIFDTNWQRGKDFEKKIVIVKKNTDFHLIRLFLRLAKLNQHYACILTFPTQISSQKQILKWFVLCLALMEDLKDYFDSTSPNPNSETRFVGPVFFYSLVFFDRSS